MAPWIRWEIDDCKTARDEGWFLYCRNRFSEVEIRRWTRRTRFVSDMAAVRFVRRRAHAGSSLHQIAVVIHDFYRGIKADADRSRLQKSHVKKMRCGSLDLTRQRNRESTA